ncbi:MAG TPA: hypothetical protein VIY29_21735, partial [Ktedonobacteraceae bacterium]
WTTWPGGGATSASITSSSPTAARAMPPTPLPWRRPTAPGWRNSPGPGSWTRTCWRVGYSTCSVRRRTRQSRPDIDAIFAFDHHLTLAGIPVLPGPLKRSVSE